MSLTIRQEIFSTLTKYEITDDQGQPVYTTEGRAKGQFFVVGSQIHLFDKLGNEIAFVHEVFPNLFGKYELFLHGEKKGIIVGKLAFMKPKYKVDFLGYRVEGDIMGFRFQIFQKDRLVATMIPEVISIGNVYSLTCPNPEDELAALTLSIAIAGVRGNGLIIWDFVS